MADAARNITIKVLLDEAKARAGLKRMGDDAETTGTRWSRMGDLAKAGIAVAAGAVVTFLSDATKAAIDDEKAQADLALALQNTVEATDDEIAATEKWIEKTALATGVADDELRPALEGLTRATGDLDEAQGLLTTAMDIAAATGKPLQTVVDAIAKAALNGSTGGLARLGLKVRDVNGEMLTLDQIMDNAKDTMGGAMSTAAETAAGKLDRLTVAFDESKEEIGASFIPILIEAADAVLKLMEKFEDPPKSDEIVDPFTSDLVKLNEETPVAYEWISKLGDSFAALGDLLGITVAPTIGETYDVLSSARMPIRDIEEAHEDLTVAIDDSTESFYDHQDAVRELTDPVWALAEAEREQAEAITAAMDAAEEYGEGSPQHLEALGKVADAAYDVQDAEKAMADQAPVTRSKMESHLRSLRVYTEEQIQLMLDEFERINAFKFSTKNITLVRKITGGGVQEHAAAGGPVSGGPVLVGERGPEVFVPGQRGTVIPNRQLGSTNNITIHAGLGSDPNAISKAVVEALQRYERSSGPIPIRTRAS